MLMMAYEQFVKEFEPFNIEPFDESILTELWENRFSFNAFTKDPRYERFTIEENLIKHADGLTTIGRLVFSYLEENYALFVIDIHDNGQNIRKYHVKPYLGVICKCWYK
jgi:hypothetical protein